MRTKKRISTRCVLNDGHIRTHYEKYRCSVLRREVLCRYMNCAAYLQLLTNDDLNRVAQVLRVRSRLAGSDASKQLRDGDMLLAINKIPVWGYRDIEGFVNGRTPTSGAKRPHSVAFPDGGAVQGPGPGPPDGETACGSLDLTIFRDHQITDIPVQLGHETGRGTEHMVHWCGAQLQVWTLFLFMWTKVYCLLAYEHPCYFDVQPD
jgi:hypothetical protein